MTDLVSTLETTREIAADLTGIAPDQIQTVTMQLNALRKQGLLTGVETEQFATTVQQPQPGSVRAFAQAHVGNTPIGFPVSPAKPAETAGASGHVMTDKEQV